MNVSSGTATLTMRTFALPVRATSATRTATRVRVRSLPAVVATVRLLSIFSTFLVIGASSFGGGVTGHLREHLVRRRQWLTEDEFLAALEISQVLPGLNSTNLATVAGDKLAGLPGAVLAVLGLVLPGVLSILALGALYVAFGTHTQALQFLKGASAAAVGLMLATTLEVGRRPMRRPDGVLLAGLTFVLSAALKLSLPQVLLVLGPISLWWHRRRP